MELQDLVHASGAAALVVGIGYAVWSVGRLVLLAVAVRAALKARDDTSREQTRYVLDALLRTRHHGSSGSRAP